MAPDTLRRDPLAVLRRPSTIRRRCAAIARAVDEGRSPHFRIDRSRLQSTAELVVQVMRERYPDGRIPPHSRWRQFEAGGVDRRAELDALLSGRSPAERARAHFDLVVPSVLLDAGAGAAWRYREHAETADSLALPVQRRRTDDLLALLDRVGATPRGAGAARAKAAVASTADAAAVAAPRPSPGNGPAADATAAAGPTAAPEAAPKAAPDAAPDKATGAAPAEAPVEDPAAAPSAAPAADPATASTATPDTAPTVSSPASVPASVSASAPAAAPAQTSSVKPAAVTGPTLARSEGLAVASFRAFVGGVFSASADDPLRSDALTLHLLDAAALRDVFQVSTSNPLVGLDGRAGLLSRLGDALRAEADRGGGEARPGLLFDRITEGGKRTEVSASELLALVLRVLAPVWTSGPRIVGLPAGDVWPHHWAGHDDGDGRIDRSTPGFVPFHKLSQWLVYSLLEPLQWAGVQVQGVEELTGLPEYRNGGLLIDTGVIVPRHALDAQRSWKPAEEMVIEWRALTVVLLDELAELVRGQLGMDAAQLPLACVLEGGTWAAGRQLANERREGAPPFKIDSDGTVF